ncbi:MAG: hypothetical protein ACI867_000612 [Glaciecola sp.]|jgi:hypothetical protein
MVRRPVNLGGDVTRVPDDLPPSGLTAPVRVDQLKATWDKGQSRAEFRVVIKDADGKRCPNLAVEAHVTGPTRAAGAEITTDMMGAAIFRMHDGPGTYTLEVRDVGAKGITWDPAAGAALTAEVATPA